ncbi:MAG: NADH:flavin oxidoreductase [Planctomycetes bacterium]|nr:NADH:flavin oxidoreductase [Planctomycetota bacterium]
MWHPPERIRHPLPAARWPTEGEAAASRLFSPVQAGPVRLESRTWVPAMVPWRATGDGFVTRQVLDWYGRFARGRPGALVVEATGVRDIPSGPLLRIGHDRFLPGLGVLVETVRKESGGHTRLFIQIIDFLSVKRRPEPGKFFERFLKVTDTHREACRVATGWPAPEEGAVRSWLASLPDAALDGVLAPRELEDLRYGYRERVTDMHLPHVRDLPKLLPDIFASAAERAGKAGFDGVELHYAHAYTMASFLSATNTRDDGYGGTRERRVRLPLEVYRAVRARTGSGFAVGCRFLAEESVVGGSTLDDACFFGVEFARAGMDFLSLSRGGKFDDAKRPDVGWAVYPYTGRSGYECMPTVISDARGPFGRNLPAAAAVRRSIRRAGFPTPVVAVGGIGTFEIAEAVLKHGEADIVGAARATLADPDWFLKARQGRGAAVRRCEYTNYCEGLDQKHKVVTCKLWDRVGLDALRASGAPPEAFSADGRRRLTAPG